MTDPMSDARLDEIARVHASVDRFPFTSDRYGVRDVDGDMITDSYGLFWTEELAEFVALSSTAVPELLAEVRRLREENERLRAVADAARDASGALRMFVGVYSGRTLDAAKATQYADRLDAAIRDAWRKA